MTKISFMVCNADLTLSQKMQYRIENLRGSKRPCADDEVTAIIHELTSAMKMKHIKVCKV
jgi:hypothetical protein